MSDESALAVQVAENQSGEAPDSGGKEGAKAPFFRAAYDAQVELANARVRGAVLHSLDGRLTELAKRLDGMAASQQALEKYMDELKAKVEKLEARPAAGLPPPSPIPDGASWRLGAEAPTADMWAMLLGEEVCEEPVVHCVLSGWRALPGTPEQRVLRDMVRELVRELRAARKVAEQSLRDRVPSFVVPPGAVEGLDRSVRAAAEAPRENPGGMTAEDFRKAADKEQPGRLVQPYERQAAAEFLAIERSPVSGESIADARCRMVPCACGEVADLVAWKRWHEERGQVTPGEHGTAGCSKGVAEYAALPFSERSGVAYRAEREAMRQVGRPCPKVGCQGILAKDYAGGAAWCPECRAAQKVDQPPAKDGAEYSRPANNRRGDFARAQGAEQTVYRPPEGTRPDKVACPRAGCGGFLVKWPDAHRCNECNLTAKVVGVAG